MSKPTFQERCLLAEQCLPDAPYRAMLKKLHAEMLEALAEQPAPPPECQTEAEKTAFAFGWWKALEHVRQQPAQRTWVELTDEEIDDLLDTYITAEGRARAIEAKLKEKNT